MVFVIDLEVGHITDPDLIGLSRDDTNGFGAEAGEVAVLMGRWSVDAIATGNLSTLCHQSSNAVETDTMASLTHLVMNRGASQAPPALIEQLFDQSA